MKVDKRRKKKAAEEADARADAVFAEEVRDCKLSSRPNAGIRGDSQGAGSSVLACCLLRGVHTQQHNQSKHL